MPKYSAVQRRYLGALSAIAFISLLLSSCAEVTPEPRVKDPETEPTQISIDLTSVESKDGRRSYRMQTPLMKRYELSENPSSEFEKGIFVETFNDSTFVVESDIKADYAHYDENSELWEARGNVVAHNYVGDRTLYTEKLWWNEKEDKIYSDTLVRVVEGRDQHIGVGFESDGGFNQWIFNNPRGKMTVEMSSDSTKRAEPDTVEMSSPPPPDLFRGTTPQ